MVKQSLLPAAIHCRARSSIALPTLPSTRRASPRTKRLIGAILVCSVPGTGPAALGVVRPWISSNAKWATRPAVEQTPARNDASGGCRSR